MRGIKIFPTIIYRLEKYSDTGIPRYFVTSLIVSNFCKNPIVQEVVDEKDLGITVVNNLKPSSQCAKGTAKAVQVLGLIKGILF